MTTPAALAPEKLARPEPKRDRWGRYLLPVPGSPKPVAHTRVTTLVRAIDDTSNLEKWACRMAVIGVAQRPDLRAMVLSHVDDRDQLNRVVATAKEVAKSSAGANTGTALHRMCEHVDLGLPLDGVDEWQADLDAYRRTLDTNGVEVLADWVERIVRVPDLRAAGTFDRLVRVGGRLVVADIKTGSIDYGHATIPAQLACYAHGAVWNGDSDTSEAANAYQPLTELGVDQSRGLIIHLPAGTGECTLHWVDLEAGWEIAQLCHTVREWRKVKTTIVPFDRPPVDLPSPPDTTERTAWIIGRITALAEPGRDVLRAAWPDGVPAVGQPWTDQHIDALAAALDQAEAAIEAPFQPNDPATLVEQRPRPVPVERTPCTAKVIEVEPDRPLTDDEVAQVKARVDQCSDPAQLGAWASQAAAAGLTVGIKTHPTLLNGRRLIAMLACVEHGDELARTLIHAVTLVEPQPVEPTGALIASLTIEQATALYEAARGITGRHLALTFADDGHPVVAPIAA